MVVPGGTWSMARSVALCPACTCKVMAGSAAGAWARATLGPEVASTKARATAAIAVAAAERRSEEEKQERMQTSAGVMKEQNNGRPYHQKKKRPRP